MARWILWREAKLTGLATELAPMLDVGVTLLTMSDEHQDTVQAPRCTRDDEAKDDCSWLECEDQA